MPAYRPKNGFKLFGFLDRRSDLTLEQFQLHWRTIHADHAVKLTPYMSLYLQNHAHAAPLPGFRRPCDGSPELWFESVEKIAQMGVSPEYMDGAYLDELEFMADRAIGVIATETVLLPGAPIAPDTREPKAIAFLKRRDGVSLEEIQGALGSLDVPAVDVHGLNRHIRSFAIVTEPGVDPLFDAIEEYWWADDSGLEAGWGRGAIRAEIASMVDVEASAALRVDEIRPYWPNSGVDFRSE
ncbi:MAG: EthD domain-containing protein [Pseudomonadota bacterium]